MANGYFGKMEILTSKTDFVSVDLNSSQELATATAPLTWQQHMKAAIRSLTDLRNRLELVCNPSIPGLNPEIKALESFPVFVPLPYLERIEKGNPADPLLCQILPTIDEDLKLAGYVDDPLQELAATQGPGILQKYQGRVLLVTTGACAVNCRYCFRRHFPYDESPKSPAQWQQAIQQISLDDSIDEVILSGGDPLTLVDETLGQMFAQIGAISLIKRIRIHTRLPIMIPQRVTERLLEMLAHLNQQVIMVIHANHANELDQSVAIALAKLADSGVMLLNQSVLLNGVNNDAEVLIQLSKRLLECRVMPYYLHKNDPVAGTAKFEVSVERGVELIGLMRASLPGYAVPRFVQELSGKPNKTVLA